ncbi:hypothetical protein M427DRAFT_139236 [Gonapodya prolifera JEL478]|uniref:Transcription factor domain-containing protein n=1 Tax=Gonapodya prolifera (strain JEL478) TaxID=1344416 RepID=A0A139A114_GONPJ|nr:hypothetical protein M427DRAFT_139236 [Gonapodya prolifera JEL478]|eukprot:KXS10470.1 hypothetical protein M427DRAFT_139236 [Gonapodya prolifera JEL478]
MLSIACGYHSSPLFQSNIRKTFSTYSTRLIPVVLSQRASLPSIQTLLHFAVDSLQAERVEWFAAMVATSVGGVRVLQAMPPYSESNRNMSDPVPFFDRWLEREEALRTCWTVGLMDRMLAAWHNCPCGMTYEELALAPLPSNDAIWFSDSFSDYIHGTTLDSVTFPLGLTLEEFFDNGEIPIANQSTLGVAGLSTALSFFCFGKMLEFRQHCSRRHIYSITTVSDTVPNSMRRALALATDIESSMAMWYRRFETLLLTQSLPVHSVPGPSAEHLSSHISSSKWALTLFIQYHCMHAFSQAPIAPFQSGSGGRRGPFGSPGSSPGQEPSDATTTPFILAWMVSPAFVKCLDHASIALTSLQLFFELHGEGSLLEHTSAAWGFCLGMATVSTLLAVREVLRTSPAHDCAESKDPLKEAPESNELMIARQFLIGADSHVRTTIRALRSIGRVWKRAQTATRLIERLHNSIMENNAAPHTDRVLTWVAERQSEIILHLVTVAAGKSEVPPDLAANTVPLARSETVCSVRPELFEGRGTLAELLEDQTVQSSEELVDRALERVAQLTE